MAKLPGSVWISGANIHFIDASGNEYYYTGDFQGNPGCLPGSVWIEGDNLAYADAGGAKRTLQGIYDNTGISALAGCIWVESSRLKATVPGVHKRNYHYDTAGGSVPHTDAHGDTPHVDGGGGHSDFFSDTGHGDEAHGDGNLHQVHSDSGPLYCDGHYDVASGGTHQDFYFNEHPEWYPYLACYGDYAPPIEGSHGDANVGYTFGHLDIPEHTDHMDGPPHNDTPAHNDHGDAASHTDVPHVNTHNDVPHTDTPHSDQPVYVGP